MTFKILKVIVNIIILVKILVLIIIFYPRKKIRIESGGYKDDILSNEISIKSGGGYKDIFSNENIFNYATYLVNEKKNDQANKLYKFLYDKKYNQYNIGSYLISVDKSQQAKIIFKDLCKNLEESKDDQKITLLKINFYKNCLLNPHIYDLSIEDLDKYRNDFSNIIENTNNLKDIDIFRFNIFSKISNLHNVKYLFSEEEIQKQRISNKKANTDTLGIYSINKNNSPCFYHFIEVYYFLSQINKKIVFFLDNNLNELNEYDKEMLKDVELHCVKDLDDNKLCDLIKSKNINKLICQNVHYQRINILYQKPCNIIINGLDGGWTFPNFLFDYNLFYKNDFEDIKGVNLLKLKKLLPVYKNNDKYEIILTKPEYDNRYIKIGLITTAMKLSGDLIFFIKKILNNNENIKLTIYSQGLKKYLQKIIDVYDEKRLFITTYNNSSNMELRSNLFYLDTFHCNNHSTLMEILSSYRPLISYTDTEKYFGNVSGSIIESIDMKKELNANNPDDYYNLVMKYVNSEEEYTTMFSKFSKNLDKFKILDNKTYAQELYLKIQNCCNLTENVENK